MATAAGDGMSPKPDSDFGLILSHGVDTEKNTPTHLSSNHVTHSHGLYDTAEDNLESNATDDTSNNHGPVEEEPYSDEFSHHHQRVHDTMEMVVPTTEHMDYGTFPKGFSDDEDTGDAFERSWEGRKPRMALPKSKKSPRRMSDEDMSPKTKKPRQSLFGGPSEGDDATTPKTPGEGIRFRMSSLNLDQQEKELSPSDRPFNLGFGIGHASSERGSLSPRVSPVPSEESVIIPPDDQVRAPVASIYVSPVYTYFILSLCTRSARISSARKLSRISIPTSPGISTLPKKPGKHRSSRKQKELKSPPLSRRRGRGRAKRALIPSQL